MDIVVPVGEDFSMQVTASPPAALAKCAFDVVFDQSALTLLRVEPGPTVAGKLRSGQRGNVVSVTLDAGEDFDGAVCIMVFSGRKAAFTQLVIAPAEAADAARNAMKVSCPPASIRVVGGGDAI